MAKASSSRSKTTRRKTTTKSAANKPAKSRTKTDQGGNPGSEDVEKASQQTAVAVENNKAPAATVTEEDVQARVDRETHEKYEKVKRGELQLTALQRMTVPELHDLAKD